MIDLWGLTRVLGQRRMSPEVLFNHAAKALSLSAQYDKQQISECLVIPAHIFVLNLKVLQSVHQLRGPQADEAELPIKSLTLISTSLSP
jgi:hypothetical protein